MSQADHLDALEDSSLRKELADDFLQTWGHGEPAAAAQWAGERLDPSSHASTFGSLARAWSQYDSMGASKWVGTLPEGAGRDAAIEAFISKIAPADPAGAAAWAETFSAPALRESWKEKLER